MANKNILLIEPGYNNKYPPLGLMKIAQYHGINGKKDNVVFIKGEDKEAFDQVWDRVYITTLFSFEWKKIEQTIDFAINVVNKNTSKIFVGGIAASLMQDQFQQESKWRGIRIIKGLLDKSPSESLQLDEFEEELYSDDYDSTPIEDLVPDYSILDQIDYTYPVRDAYFAYASRGCVRKCTFCGVPKLEGAQRDARSITEVVNSVEKLYGAKKDLTLMDNNVVASSNYKNIIAEIIDLGFHAGAKLERNGRLLNRRVDFNQGVDARILCKDPMYLREMSRICIDPLRIAFDHAGMKKPYAQAIRYAAENGLNKLSNYMLYNFNDSPDDLYERMRLNIDLNEELDIRIFSFPMRYQPVTMKDRSHIGQHWNKYYLRSTQIILQATHGIVSGSPSFFKNAFGDSNEEFRNLLIRPHHFIFNREWYQNHGGRAQFDEYISQMNKMSESDFEELLAILCSNPPSGYIKAFNKLKKNYLKDVLYHYIPLKQNKEREIWNYMKKYNRDIPLEKIAADELVEDAGLGEC